MEMAHKLLSPSPPAMILLGFGVVDIALQAKQLRCKWKTKRPGNQKSVELLNLEATSRFLEESLLDVVTLFAASIAINWLYRSGLKPLGWLCIVVPLILVTLTIMLYIRKLRSQKRK